MPQRARGVGNMQWQSGGMCKSTLQVYGEHKPTAAKERLYDNNIGSVLLFEARVERCARSLTVAASIQIASSSRHLS